MFSRTIRTALAVSTMLAVGWGTAAAQSAGPRQLQLSFGADGTVTLHAAHVSPSEILREWARQCGCFIVNADKLTTPLPVPVAFDAQPQSRVLESLLRGAAGYVFTPKRAGSTSVSNYETIYVLATSSPTESGVVDTYTPPAYAPANVLPPSPGSPDDEIPPVVPAEPPRAPNAPPTAPPAQVGTPAAAQPPAGVPQNLPGLPSGIQPVPIIPVTPKPPTSGTGSGTP
jgi:hypothetical protein